MGDTKMGCRNSKWSKNERQTRFFTNYYQQQESCTSWVGQHTKEMSEQWGQLLVGRKLIYQYPETGVIPVLSTGDVPVQHRPLWAPRVTGVPAQPRWCRVLGSLCLGTLSCESGNKGDNHRKKLLRFHMSGIGSEGLWFQQVTHSGCECEQCVPKSVCLLSPSVPYKRLWSPRISDSPLSPAETCWFHSTHTCKKCGGPDSHSEREMSSIWNFPCLHWVSVRVSLLTSTSEDLAHLYYNITSVCMFPTSQHAQLYWAVVMEAMSRCSQIENLSEIQSCPPLEVPGGRWAVRELVSDAATQGPCSTMTREKGWLKE